jgi:hypothetical protein
MSILVDPLTEYAAPSLGFRVAQESPTAADKLLAHPEAGPSGNFLTATVTNDGELHEVETPTGRTKESSASDPVVVAQFMGWLQELQEKNKSLNGQIMGLEENQRKHESEVKSLRGQLEVAETELNEMKRKNGDLESKEVRHPNIMSFEGRVLRCPSRSLQRRDKACILSMEMEIGKYQVQLSKGYVPCLAMLLSAVCR